jgi:hypothetical protein
MSERTLCDAHRAALSQYRELAELDIVPDPRSQRDRFRLVHVEDNKKARFIAIERQRREPDGWRTVASLRIMERQLAPILDSLEWVAGQIL